MGASAMAALLAMSACAGSAARPSASSGADLAAHDPAPRGLTRTPQSDDAILDRLSAARCEREESCRNVGDGRMYASKSACIERVRDGIATDVKPHTCSNGVDGAELERCAAALEFERCDRALDSLAGMDRCQTAALCVK
jgi:hypothetical protein